jgi:site-specific DNA recombinase
MKPVRAAVYIRMSDDKQENSPERQRSTIYPYLERQGYKMVGDPYEDHGMRGWDQTRPDFQRLLRDARRGLFDVIVVDEVSRLSRDDEWEFIELVANPLRNAGVVVDSVSNGRQNWNDVVGLITLAVNQSRSSLESVEMARRVATGFATKAKKGDLVLGRPPFAYERHRGHDGNFGPLVPGKPEDVRRLRWMFDAYGNQDWSLQRIATALNAQEAPTPQGGMNWSAATVRIILRNRVYVGDYVFGETTEARYYRVNGPSPDRKAVQGKKPPRVKTPQHEHIIIANHHPALVAPDLFEKVQRLMVQNRKRTTPHLIRNFLFSRLLFCGRCGNSMIGATERRKGKETKTYRCSGNMRGGQEVCSAIRISEERALTLVLGGLAHRYLTEENLAMVLEEAQALQATESSPDTQESLRKQMQTTEAKIRKAKGNLALLDAEYIPQVQAQIREWERERKGLQVEVDSLGQSQRVAEAQEFISQVKEMVRQLGQQQDDPGLVRAYLAEVVERVEVHTRKVQKAKRVGNPLDHLVIKVKGGAEVEMPAPEPTRQ